MRKISRSYFIQETIEFPACQRAFELATSFAEADPAVQRVVVSYNPLQEVEWFLRDLSGTLPRRKRMKELEAGQMLPGCRVPVFVLPTHKAEQPREGAEVMIAWGLKAKAIFELEPLECIQYLIALPLNHRLIHHWAYVAGAELVQVAGEEGFEAYVEPHCIVRAALEELGTWLRADQDMTSYDTRKEFRTFLHHVRFAETEEGFKLNTDAVMAYMHRVKGWDYLQAKHLAGRLETTRNRVNSVYWDPETAEAQVARWKAACSVAVG
jgi:hypothetical protein